MDDFQYFCGAPVVENLQSFSFEDCDDVVELDYGNEEDYLNASSDEGFSFGADQEAVAKQLPRDPLLQLVSLQKASGYWLLDPALAAALGKTSEEVENKKPSAVNQEVWATILALIWLHGFKMDAREEWELLAMKAGSWLRAQNAPCVTECVEAGNALLGCNVQKDALGL